MQESPVVVVGRVGHKCERETVGGSRGSVEKMTGTPFKLNWKLGSLGVAVC